MAQNGSSSNSSQAAPGGGVALPPTPQQLQSLFDNGVWYAISLWPALHVATSNNWGGPDSSDKKDWFAGAVSDLFSQRADTDQDELELFLLQIMQDEFDCNVEDDSEMEIASTIMGLRKSLMERNLGPAKEIERRWKNRGQLKMNVQIIDNGEQDDDDDDDDDDDEEDFEGFCDDDVDMSGVQETAPPVEKEKKEPEIDEDGFTKVISKKKR